MSRAVLASTQPVFVLREGMMPRAVLASTQLVVSCVWVWRTFDEWWCADVAVLCVYGSEVGGPNVHVHDTLSILFVTCANLHMLALQLPCLLVHTCCTFLCCYVRVFVSGAHALLCTRATPSYYTGAVHTLKARSLCTHPHYCKLTHVRVITLPLAWPTCGHFAWVCTCTCDASARVIYPHECITRVLYQEHTRVAVPRLAAGRV